MASGRVAGERDGAAFASAAEPRNSASAAETRPLARGDDRTRLGRRAPPDRLLERRLEIALHPLLADANALVADSSAAAGSPGPTSPIFSAHPFARALPPREAPPIDARARAVEKRSRSLKRRSSGSSVWCEGDTPERRVPVDALRERRD